MNQKLIALWRYDLPPYYLADEVESVKEGGRVSVKGYPGFLFQSVKIVPYEEGMIMKHKLDELKSKYREESDSLTRETRLAADNILNGVY